MNSHFNHLFAIGPSKIHGKGLMAKTFIHKGQIIGVVIDGRKVTRDMGKWVNHSYQPNARLLLYRNRYYLVALKNIDRGQEIVADYRDTPDFIEKPKFWYR